METSTTEDMWKYLTNMFELKIVSKVPLFKVNKNHNKNKDKINKKIHTREVNYINALLMNPSLQYSLTCLLLSMYN